MSTLETKLQESQYANKTDWEVANMLNAEDVSLPLKYRNSISSDTLMGILIAYDVWQTISNFASQDQSITKNRACKNIYDVIALRKIDLNLQDAKIRETFENLLSFMQSEAIITAEMASYIESKAKTFQSWAEYTGIEVTPRTVGLARGGRA